MTKPAKRGRGRPQIDPAKLDVMLDHVKAGVPVYYAVARAGISRGLVYELIKAGKAQKRGRARDFLDRLKAAEAQAVAGLHLVVANSAAGDEAKQIPANPADARWLLTRLAPKYYGERRTIKHEGEPPIGRNEVFTAMRELGQAAQQEIVDALGMDAAEPILRKIHERWTAVIKARVATSKTEVVTDITEDHGLDATRRQIRASSGDRD